MTNNAPTTVSDAETPASPSHSVPKRSGFARFVTPILALVAALGIGLLGGVLIGHATADTSTQAGGRTFPGGGGQGAQGANRGGFTSGEVTTIEGDVITLKLADGSTVTVTANSDTTVTTTSDADLSDLDEGDTITAVGKADSDGNVTATTISEGQTGFGGGFGGGAGGGTPSNGTTTR